jgi:hypothetical protein
MALNDDQIQGKGCYALSYSSWAMNIFFSLHDEQLIKEREKKG